MTGLEQQGVCWRWWGARRADTAAGAGVHSAAGGLGSGARSLGPCDAAARSALPDSSPGRSDPALGAGGDRGAPAAASGPRGGRGPWGCTWADVSEHVRVCACPCVRARTHMPQFSFLHVSASSGTCGPPPPDPRGLPGLPRTCRWDEPSVEGAELCGPHAGAQL